MFHSDISSTVESKLCGTSQICNINTCEVKWKARFTVPFSHVVSRHIMHSGWQPDPTLQICPNYTYREKWKTSCICILPVTHVRYCGRLAKLYQSDIYRSDMSDFVDGKHCCTSHTFIYLMFSGKQAVLYQADIHRSHRSGTVESKLNSNCQTCNIQHVKY